jgi:hypothetical protein
VGAGSRAALSAAESQDAPRGELLRASATVHTAVDFGALLIVPRVILGDWLRPWDDSCDVRINIRIAGGPLRPFLASLLSQGGLLALMFLLIFLALTFLCRWVRGHTLTSIPWRLRRTARDRTQLDSILNWIVSNLAGFDCNWQTRSA